MRLQRLPLSLFVGFLALELFFPAGGCGGTITQEPPDDPSNVPDASADADDSSDAATSSDASAEGGVTNTIIGSPCNLDADCGTGYRCHPTVPGGYCTVDCSPNQACPQGSVCSPVPLSRIAGICMLPCSSPNECRSEYTCGIVYLFPNDPNAPSSQVPVCWVPPP